MKAKARTAGFIALPAIVLLGVAIGVGGAEDVDVNARNPDGSTPLQWAVYEVDAAKVERLLDAGADPSIANNYGATPMGLAAEVAHTEDPEAVARRRCGCRLAERRGHDGPDAGGANR